MFQGQYLWTNEANGESFYSPWMPRQADNVTMTLDLMQAMGAKLKVELITKSLETAGDGTTVGATISLQGTPNEYTATASGVNELVRYKFTVDADVDETIGGVLFRMLDLLWYDTVKA